jgi:CBS domain-containing protein
VRLSVRRLRLLDADGNCNDTPNVFCPRHRRTTSLTTCLACTRLLLATDDSIECATVRAESLAYDAFDPRLGGDVCVGDVAGHATVCVLADVSAAVLARSLKEEGSAFAVVVEAPARFVGLVDLESAAFAGDGVSVRQLARRVHPVREAAPLAFAVERMVHERARALPVVDEEGFLVALLSDIDALRWVAGRARNG